MKRAIAVVACVLTLAACGNAPDEAKADEAKAAEEQVSADTQTSTAPQSNTKSDAKAESSAGNETGFAGEMAKRSYALGMDIGSSVSQLPVTLDVDALAQGVRDVVSGADTRLSKQEMTVVLQGFMQEIQAAQVEELKHKAQANLEAGQAFLAENKAKEGVKVTDSGLQYKVLKEGDGPQPAVDDSVTVHYTGMLIDGTVFDSSRKRGKPTTFPVNAVIPGWTEALQLMHEGAKYKLFIPAELAYGMRGAGAKIGPNEALIFEVELLKVNQKNNGDASASTTDSAESAETVSSADANSSGQ